MISKCQTCGVFLDPAVRKCPQCGATVHLRPPEPTRPSNGLLSRIVPVAGYVAVLIGLAVWGRYAHVQEQASRRPARSSSVQRDSTAQTTAVWSLLRREYPELQISWKDLSGRRFVAVPREFWNVMLDSEKVRLARELDTLFPGQDWTVVIGRYWGGTRMALQESHARPEVHDPRMVTPAVPASPTRRPTPPVTRSVMESPASDPAVPPEPSETVTVRRLPSLPTYEVLMAVDEIRGNRRYGEILVPELHPDTPVEECKRIAQAIAAFENLDDVTLYRTLEAREAHYSMDFDDRHPDALVDGLIGSLERGRFRPHRSR